MGVGLLLSPSFQLEFVILFRIIRRLFEISGFAVKKPT